MDTLPASHPPITPESLLLGQGWIEFVLMLLVLLLVIVEIIEIARAIADWLAMEFEVLLGRRSALDGEHGQYLDGKDLRSFRLQMTSNQPPLSTLIYAPVNAYTSARTIRSTDTPCWDI